MFSVPGREISSRHRFHVVRRWWAICSFWVDGRDVHMLAAVFLTAAGAVEFPPAVRDGRGPWWRPAQGDPPWGG